MEVKDEKTCPGCSGNKVRYQLPAQLGGDHLSQTEWEAAGKPFSQKIKCGTCNGTGKV